MKNKKQLVEIFIPDHYMNCSGSMIFWVLKCLENILTKSFKVCCLNKELEENLITSERDTGESSVYLRLLVNPIVVQFVDQSIQLNNHLLPIPL